MCAAMYFLGFLLAVVSVAKAQTQTQKGPCYVFPGPGELSFLEFKPNNFDISDRALYTLEFQTTASSGVLLYAEGEDDYEALFLSEGRLYYLLTNPSPSGVEGTSGGFYVSNDVVNNGTWLTVKLWRNKMKEVHHNHEVLQTGMEIEDTAKNTSESHVDNIYHRMVDLQPSVYIGGLRPNLVHTRGSAVPQFEGKIRGIHEAENGEHFENIDTNWMNRITSCS